MTTDTSSLKTIVLCFNAAAAIFAIAIPRMGETIVIDVEILLRFWRIG